MKERAKFTIYMHIDAHQCIYIYTKLYTILYYIILYPIYCIEGRRPKIL